MKSKDTNKIIYQPIFYLTYTFWREANINLIYKEQVKGNVSLSCSFKFILNSEQKLHLLIEFAILILDYLLILSLFLQ